MRREKDFEDFLKCLNTNKVKYCIVGAFAVIYHSKPRYSGDMDILIEPSLTNSKKTKKAMEEFGISISGIEDEYFSISGNFYQIGVAPVMIHIITSLDGVDLKTVFKNRIKARYGDTKTYYIGLAELIKNKKSTNRLQDKIDLKILEEVRKRKFQ